MESVHGTLSDRRRLADVLRDVRLRWRLKRALFGGTITLVLGFAVLAAASYVMAAFHYADVPVLVTRIVALVAVIAIVIRYLLLPLRANPRDHQVALYIEEHDPALDGALLTAVELSRTSADAAAAMSPALAGRLMRAALERLRTLDDGRRVDGAGLTRTGAVFAAVLAAAIITLIVGPTSLRYGMSISLQPWRAASPAGLFSIAVTPGNATVARGGDQLVAASLHGFQADRVQLMVRPADSTGWTPLLMAADSTGTYHFRLFDIGAPMDYLVEAAGVQSGTYHLNVANLASVKRMDLQYRYPAYTRLPPRDVPETGDIAAPAGTRVRVRVTPTVPASAGRLVFDDGDTMALAADSDGTLSGVVRVAHSGFYKVELATPGATMLTASLDYNVDVLADRPPTVSFTKPGRDERVLSVDEVYTQARAEDDYGIAALDLVYSVNGGREHVVPLSHAAARAPRDVSAGYTFMLEDDSLQPGDVVSYYARATDNDSVGAPHTATTDIYFLNVRPYEEDYRQQQSGGAGAGAGRGSNAGQLSRQEREIIAGTFNVARDSATTAVRDLQENLATLRLSQQKLRQQTAQLVQQLVQRGIAATDTGFKKIADDLARATPQMDTAERLLAAGTPTGALPSEQRALAELQRAEAVFHDIQVSEGNGQGGGGGGGANAADLADIFELNKDRLRNQYETVQRGQTAQQRQQEQANQQEDQLLEKLKQLAARQQQQDQRAQRMADSLSRRLGASGASSGQGQRQVAQQTEDAARQLDRLAQQQHSQTLADAARRLHDAADAMRQAAADHGQQGAASGAQALEQLENARRLLDRDRSQRAQRAVDDALQTQRGLADQQQRVANEIAQLGNGAPAGQAQQRNAIAEQQHAMEDSIRALTSRLQRGALDAQSEHPDVARTMTAAADSLQKRGTADRLGYMAQNLTRTAPQAYLSQQQAPIGGDIADLGRQLERARSEASRQTQAERRAEDLDRMRGLVQGLQSVDDRLQQQSAQVAQAGQPGQQGGRGAPQGRGQAPTQNGNPTGAPIAGGRGGRGSPQGAGAPAMNGGRPGASTPRGLSPQEAQQFSRELGQRLADADSLRGDLRRQGVDVAELDRSIDNLRALARPSALENANAAATLQSQVVQGLAAYEFALRRAFGADEDRMLVGGSNDVPPAFRALVEQYYRAIARTQKPIRPN